MIEGKGIRVGYGEKEVLHGVDFVFPAGQVTAIIGPNGCGKSTLLKTVAGLLSCKGGSLTAEGIDLTACSAGQRAQTVSYLPQNRQTPELTVGTLVLHGRFSRLRYPRRYGEEDRQAAQKAMEWAGIAHLKEERLPRLSGGMQQKAYLAMALCQDAKVLLLDEPTTFLDISQQLRLMQTAKELALGGKAVVLVLHDLSLALQTADRLILMQEGKVLRQGTAEELLADGLLQRVFGVGVEKTGGERGYRFFLSGEEHK